MPDVVRGGKRIRRRKQIIFLHIFTDYDMSRAAVWREGCLSLARWRGAMRWMCMKWKLNFRNYVIYDFSHWIMIFLNIFHIFPTIALVICVGVRFVHNIQIGIICIEFPLIWLYFPDFPLSGQRIHSSSQQPAKFRNRNWPSSSYRHLRSWPVICLAQTPGWYHYWWWLSMWPMNCHITLG